MRLLLALLLGACCLVLTAAERTGPIRTDLCGRMYHREHNGAIVSHPKLLLEGYPNNYYCLWRIAAPPGHRIRLFSPFISIEYEKNCAFDRLWIYDDSNTRKESRLIAKVCGANHDYFISTGAYLTLLWETDLLGSKSGFILRYEFIPQNAVNATTTRMSRSTRCSSKETKCPDGFCLPNKFLCDGFNDCGNNIDEQGCPTTPAPPTPRPTTTTTTTITAVPPAGGATAPPSSRACGRPTIAPDLDETRVVGGKVAISGSWPWTISLRLQGSHVCGGSIIGPSWVLTAAHCVEGYLNSRWTIVAGLHKETDLNPSQVQVREVQQIIVHPEWDKRSTNSDYTLLRLKTPVTYTNRIGPICLPSNPVGANVGCFVAGWGATKGTGGEGFLKQAFVKTFSQADCNGFYGAITNKMICAGHREGGRDTCQGDSGGPLMCKIGSNFELHGATSFGGVCAAPNSPGVYSRISAVTPWIRSKTGL